MFCQDANDVDGKIIGPVCACVCTDQEDTAVFLSSVVC